VLQIVIIIDHALPAEAYQIASRLRQMSPERIYVFGSYARGQAGPDSDLDFLVVVPDSGKTRYQRAVEARGLVRDIHVPKDIIVLTRAEWEKELKAPCSLSSTALREGISMGDE
jgi:predicted nucleotidyltransferase